MKNNVGKNLEKCASILLNGGVVAFPTETVMGLGVVYDNEESYNRLNIIKGRPDSKPYTMMLAGVADIAKYAYVDERSKKVIDAFMPGPITVLLRAKENVPSYVTHGTGIIGIRVPDFDLLTELLKKVNKPLLVPSANPSGKPSAVTPVQVLVYFGETLDYIYDYKSNGELPSTIVDLTGKEVKIIREGKITEEFIVNTIKEK